MNTVQTSSINEPIPIVANTDVSVPQEQVLTQEVAQESDKQVIARLATLDQIEYDRARKSEAKKLGVQVATLDAQVKAVRTVVSPVAPLPFQDWEPHPDKVDLAQLLSEMSATVSSLVILDPVQADATALWIAHTHVADVADISPLAIINAPEKACAKTLTQTVLAKMCKRSLQASNASSSAIFRAVENWKCTLFIDEADTFFRDNPELHGLVNAGYSKGGVVLRSEVSGDSFEPRMFSVYGPKSIAGIALERHLPDSTMSRGIIFNLRRKLPHESVKRLRDIDKSIFERIGSKLVRFAQDYSLQLRQVRPHLPDELSDRQQDNWEILLAIAQCAGPEWMERGTKACLVISNAAVPSVSTGNELLSDIQAVFEKAQVSKISTADLITALENEPESAWATYNRGKPLSPRQLAKMLAVYGIHPKTVRMTLGTPKGYDVDQFADAFARYLGTPLKVAATPQRRNASPENSADVAGGGVADTLQVPDSHDEF